MGTPIAFSTCDGSKIALVQAAAEEIAISFNAANNTVVVQPCLQRKFNGDEVPSNLPLINDVPVAFFGGGGFFITTTPAKGDYCLLMISDRCIELWKQAGGIVSPRKARHHDMTDAIAYFGLNPFNSAIPSVQTGAIHIRSKDGLTGVKIKNDTITLEQGGVAIGTVTGSSVAFTVNVTAPDFITDAGVSLGGHTHTGDSGGNTSPPNL